MTTKMFVGEDFESAYERAFGGRRNGGFGDGGRDILVPGFGGVQVKASPKGAMSFLQESLRRGRFIPLCIGEPGAKEEMLESLKKFGAWVGKEVPGRNELLGGIAQVRAIVGNTEGVGKESYVRA